MKSKCLDRWVRQESHNKMWDVSSGVGAIPINEQDGWRSINSFWALEGLVMVGKLTWTAAV